MEWQRKSNQGSVGLVVFTALILSLYGAVMGSRAEERASRSERAAAAHTAMIDAAEARAAAAERSAAKLSVELGAVRKELRLASADRDVAFLILEDVRIAIGAVAATQRGRFRAPYIKPRKRP